MKITDIRATPVNIPLEAPYVFSYGSVASLTKTIVEVDTDVGITGIGEVSDGDRSRDVAGLRDKLIGNDIRETTVAEKRCVPQMRYSPWLNLTSIRRAFGGIEMAMWDARARIDAVPLYVLLGGAIRQEIGVTEYFSYRLPGPNHPGEKTALDVARYCGRMAEAFNAGTFEGKVATFSLDEEAKMVREVRSAIGEDRTLQLDANGGWTIPTARQAIQRLDEYNIHYYEEPVESYEEMAQLRHLTSASFSSHIIDLPKAVRLGAPDTIVTNLVELGGIRRTVDFIKACRTFDVGFRFHSGDTSVASAAYLHVSAACEHVREPSQTLLRWYADDVVSEGTFVPNNGFIAVPDGPGLGVTLDRSALKRCHERYLREGEFPRGDSHQGARHEYFSKR